MEVFKSSFTMIFFLNYVYTYIVHLIVMSH